MTTYSMRSGYPNDGDLFGYGVISDEEHSYTVTRRLEWEGNGARLTIRSEMRDPVPSYQRGRTYIEPRDVYPRTKEQ